MKLTITYKSKTGDTRLTETRTLLDADGQTLLGLTVAHNNVSGRTQVMNQILGAIRGILGFTASYKLSSISDNEDSTGINVILVSR